MRRLSNRVKGIAQEVGNAVRNAFRGVLTVASTKDNISKAQVTGLADELLSDVELMQHFGFTSAPPAGSQVVVLPVGGKTTHSIIIATENGAFRVKNLKSGEVAIYDQSGSTIVLKAGRMIEVDCDEFVLKCKKYSVNATQEAKFNTPTLETTQELIAQGQFTGNGGLSVQGGKGATFSGDITQTKGGFSTNGDVTANGTSLRNHTHYEQGDGKPTSSPI